MNKKVKVVLLSVLTLVFLVVAGVVYFVNFELEDFVRAKLEEEIDESIKVDSDKMDFSLFSMTSEISDIEISKKDSADLLWQVSLEEITVSGIHPLQILFSNELIAEKVHISKPEVLIHRTSHSKKDTSGKQKKNFVLIVEKTTVEDGRLTFENDSVGFLKSSFKLGMGKFEIGQKEIEPLRISQKVSFTMSDITFVNSDSTEMLIIDEITKNRQSELIVHSLSWVPQLNLKEFSELHGWRKPYTTVNIDKVATQMPTLEKDSIYKFSKISISDADIDLEKDFSYGLPDRKTLLPQEILAKSNFSFSLDSILVEGGNSAIRLHHEEGLVAELVFENINGLAYAQNINRDTTAFGFSVQASGFNGSDLQVNTDYRYGENDPWYLSGSLSDTDLEFLSDFLRKMAGIEIASGKLEKLDFEMNGNNRINEGQVTFLYENLDIRAVHKETGKKKVVLNILTDALEELVFWKQNPSNGEMREGTYSVERDVRKGFPSQWVDGLMAGILETVSKIDPMKISRKEDKEKEK